MTPIDPDLIGIWVRLGETQTYEILRDGSYHVADPAEPVRFEQEGAVMHWGARTLVRQGGQGQTPVGLWKDAAEGDVWEFEADGRYSVTIDGTADMGIWSLDDACTNLWTRELMAQLQTNGAQITYLFREGTTATYGYTVADGVWTLNDPRNWAELARFLDPSRLADTG